MFFRFLSLLVSCFFVSVLFRFFPSVFCFFVVVVVVYFFVLYFLFVFPCLFFFTFFIIIFFLCRYYVIFAGVFKSLPFGVNGAKSGFLRASGSFGIYQKKATRTR